MNKIYLIILLLLPFTVNAQSVEEVLQKSKSVLNDTYYKTDLVYRSFDDSGVSSITETIAGFYQNTPMGYIHILDDITTILEDSILLVINDYHKEITIQSVDQDYASPQVNLSDIEDKYIKAHLSEDPDDYHIEMVFKGTYSPISKINCTISKSSFVTKNIVIYSMPSSTEKKASRIEIDYNNVKETTAINSSHRISHFIDIKAQNITTKQENLKSYKIRNHL